ncbi:MAG: hypothetical protein ACK55A_12395, partial [Gemmatimonas sp.]
MTGMLAGSASAQVQPPRPDYAARRDTAGPVLRAPVPTRAPAAADTATRDLFGDLANLGVELNARLESKLQRTRNERCTTAQLTIVGNNCRGLFQPAFDFQFNLRSGGVVADRVSVNVDYDSQREFDASNN